MPFQRNVLCKHGLYMLRHCVTNVGSGKWFRKSVSHEWRKAHLHKHVSLLGLLFTTWVVDGKPWPNSVLRLAKCLPKHFVFKPLCYCTVLYLFRSIPDGVLRCSGNDKVQELQPRVVVEEQMETDQS